MQIGPGTYRLVRDVENPCLDKRVRHDWREGRAVIKAGTEFRVAIDPEYPSLASIYLVNHHWSHQKLMTRLGGGPIKHTGQYAELTDALIAAFEPIAETDESWLDGNDINDRFARWLVTSGIMPRDELKRLYILWHES